MPISFTSDTPVQAMLRETQGLIRNRRVWTGLAVIAVIVTLLGPFGTHASLTPVERAAYWVLVVIGTFWIGVAATTALERLTPQHRIAAALLVHLTVPVPIAGFVVLVALPFGMTPGLTDALLLYANCVVLSVAVTILTRLLANPKPPAAQGTPPLIERLPASRRGDLVRLSAQGHYVEVVTTRGRGLVLMRLKDAIAEAAPEPGLRIHRSHWVALRAAEGRRAGGRPVVRTSDGLELPVSRAMTKAARKAGLI